MFVKLFTVIVRPILEYGNSVWGSTFITDERKVVKEQCRATHCLPELVDKPYDERLRMLLLPSLAHRQLRGGPDSIFQGCEKLSILVQTSNLVSSLQQLSQGDINLSFSRLKCCVCIMFVIMM